MHDRTDRVATLEVAVTPNDPAADHYELVERRQSRLRRWTTMTVYWAITLLSLGQAGPPPSVRACAIVRRHDGAVVAVIDDPPGADEPMEPLLARDLAQLTVGAFEDAWSIDD